MATVVRENIGLLHDKLTVKVSKDDYFPAFDKKLKEYSKTANILVLEKAWYLPV